MSGEHRDRGYVVLTGTSTGIGAATAVHLAEKGFHVFAGVRREADGEALQAHTSATLAPLVIDVTDEATMSAAVAPVADVVGERGLAGLVNNAGIAKPAPLEFQPIADFRTQLEVNLFGPVAMVQGFLPLIRRAVGRIVNVGSIGGMLVLPLNGAYSASKFGLRAISDALRLELRQCMLPPQLRRRTGEIGIPPEARDGDYDLVVFGSPTWWLTTNMPVRSYLESPVESMLSWLLFMFFGGPRGHFLGIKLPAPNLKPGYEEQARSFADTLLDCVVGAPAAACGES